MASTQFVKQSSSNNTTIVLQENEGFQGVYEDVTDLYNAVITVTLDTSQVATLLVFQADDNSGTDETVSSFLLSSSSNNFKKIRLQQSFFKVHVVADQATAVVGDVTVSFHELNQNVFSDPTGRLSVSNPIVMFSTNEMKFEEKLWDSKRVGTGDVNHVTGLPQTNLIVNSDGDKVIRQQHGYNIFQQSLTAYISGTLTSDDEPNVKSRIGYFDDMNDKVLDTNPTGDGFFFQKQGTQMQVVYRTSNDTSIPPTLPLSQSDTSIGRSFWNLDKLDGTGKSGSIIDFNKKQTFVVSVSEQRIILGVLSNNEIAWCHFFEFTDSPIPMVSRFSLPIRYEIEATGPLISPPVFIRQISSSVVCNGRLIDNNIYFGINKQELEVIGKRKTVPIVSLRINQSNSIDIRPRVLFSNIRLFLTSTRSSSMMYKIYKFFNPFQNDDSGPLSGNSGPSWVNGSTENGMDNSAGEFDRTSTSIDLSKSFRCVLIEQGFFSSFNPIIGKKIPLELSTNIEGKSDLICLVGRTFQGNITVSGTFQWNEFE